MDTVLLPQKNLRRPHLNGQGYKILIEAGLTWLRTNQQTVNALNVFPVPDGDTGTNMVLTMQAAMQEIAPSSERYVGKIAQAMAHGALMGARGNSGVILSQIWRGFARSLVDQPTMDAAGFAKALAEGRDTAYKGVVRPVEGTILTVAKDIAAAAKAGLNEQTDIYDILEIVVKEANASVERTPTLLKELREAGVVDAGGKGLFYLLEGMLRHVQGLPLDAAETTVQPLTAMNLENIIESIEPGQDYEWVVDFRPYRELDLQSFYAGLEEIGTSIQIGEGDGMYRMHIHVPTEKFYEPINYIRELGTVTKAVMENLMAQMEDQGGEQPCSNEPLSLQPVKPGEVAVVAVAPGQGIARVFASLGAAAIVMGGQTMNPSTQEIIHSFEDLPTDKIVVLPNNKNIILTANTAKTLSVKQVAVIPSRTVPQGLAAMMRLAPDGDFDEMVEEMNEAIHEVETGEITTATRTVDINGVDVEEGQIIALHNGKLVLSAESVEEACLHLLEEMKTDEFELVTMFYGIDVPRKEASRIMDVLREHYPDQEFELQEGCQPHYHFIISVE